MITAKKDCVRQHSNIRAAHSWSNVTSSLEEGHFNKTSAVSQTHCCVFTKLQSCQVLGYNSWSLHPQRVLPAPSMHVSPFYAGLRTASRSLQVAGLQRIAVCLQPAVCQGGGHQACRLTQHLSRDFCGVLGLQSPLQNRPPPAGCQVHLPGVLAYQPLSDHAS